MSRTFTALYFHFIFHTKCNRPLLVKSIRPRLYKYFGGIARRKGMSLLSVGGVEDHVHSLLSLPPTICVADAMKWLKAGSAYWYNHEAELPGQIQWQRGYSAFSIHKSLIPAVTRYIENQEQHHRSRSYREEVMAFLREYGIEFDERDV